MLLSATGNKLLDWKILYSKSSSSEILKFWLLPAAKLTDHRMARVAVGVVVVAVVVVVGLL